MPRQPWPLHSGRPVIEIAAPLPAQGKSLARTLLADTGAGAKQSNFDLILSERDCLSLGANPFQPTTLSGAYSGAYHVFMIQVQVPVLGFDELVRAVGISHPPLPIEGIACFPFLNRFTYGNFGDSSQFGLEL